MERKAKRLRQETGNPSLKSKLASDLSQRDRFKLAIVRPLKLLVLSPIVLALSTFMAVVYGYLYLLFTTMTEVFESTYQFSSGAVGLTYLGIGIGSLLGLFVFGAASDRIVKHKSKNGEMKPEYRLPPMIPGAFIIPIGREFTPTYHFDCSSTSPLILTYCCCNSLPVWLVRPLPRPLDRPHHRHRIRRPRPSRHVHARIHLPSRRLHLTRCLRTRCQYHITIALGSLTAVGGEKHVPNPRARVGELTPGLHRRGLVSDPDRLLPLWGADKETPTVPGQVVKMRG